MKTIAEFTKTTLIGGFLIILPIYVSIILIAKAIQGLVAALKPITAVVPAYVQFREIIAALVIITICFIAGLIVRTGPGLRAKNAFEGAVLERLPGYTLVRGLASGTVHRAGRRTDISSGARRNRRGPGPGTDHRKTR